MSTPRSYDCLLSRFKRTFGRRITSGNFIPEIDGLRFPAIAIVLVGHLLAYFHEVGTYPIARSATERALVLPIANSGKGVFLFFIISGFVLALPFVREHRAYASPVSLRQYFLRRVTRLEPPYLISLTVFLLVKLAGRAAHLTVGSEGSDVLLERYFASAFYLHNLVYGEPSLINGVAWSLEVEIQFYLLVPLLASVFLIRSSFARRALLVAVAMAAVVLQQRYGATPNRWAYSVAGSFHFFLLGFLLADIYVVGAALKTAAQARVWDLMSLVGWPLLFLAPLKGFLFPAVALLLFVAVFRGPMTNGLFSHPLITTLGGMCYSIYLLHFMVIGTAGRIVFRRLPSTGSLGTDVLLQGPLLLLLVLLVSAVYYRYVELPCMDRDWPKRVRTWMCR